MLIRPASFANENGPRFQGARAGSMGRGLEMARKPRARSPSASTNVPAPSRINWVTGRRLHTCTVLGSRESSTSVDANLAKIPPVLLDSRASTTRQPLTVDFSGNKAFDANDRKRSQEVIGAMQKINLERVCKIPAVILSLAQGAIFKCEQRTQ
jgi:hypothetical protein